MFKLMHKIKNNSKGFTLIELIVVIAILAILAAILIPSMVSYIQDADRRVRESDVRAAYSAAASAYTICRTTEDPSPTARPFADYVKEKTLSLLGKTFVDANLTIDVNETDGVKSVTYGPAGKKYKYDATEPDEKKRISKV